MAMSVTAQYGVMLCQSQLSISVTVQYVVLYCNAVSVTAQYVTMLCQSQRVEVNQLDSAERLGDCISTGLGYREAACSIPSSPSSRVVL